MSYELLRVISVLTLLVGRYRTAFRL